MPKRTKEQKVLAQRHRMMQQTSGSESNIGPSLSVKDFLRTDNAQTTPSLPSQQMPVSPQAERAKAAAFADLPLVKRDLIRIIVFTAVLLGTEFFLYYLLEVRKIVF